MKMNSAVLKQLQQSMCIVMSVLSWFFRVFPLVCRIRVWLWLGDFWFFLVFPGLLSLGVCVISVCGFCSSGQCPDGLLFCFLFW